MTTQHPYQWQGMTPEGKIIAGQISAKSRQHAKQQMATQQIVLLKLKSLGTKWYQRNLFSQSINNQHRIDFNRQLILLLEAKINLTHALKIIDDHQNHKTITKIIKAIRKEINNGHKLYVSIRPHKKLFPLLSSSLIEIGEKTDNLAYCLKQYQHYLITKTSIEHKIKQMLWYPILMICLTILIVGILITTIIPQFQLLFENAGKQLPAQTRLLLTISHHLPAYLMTLAIIALLLTMSLIITYRRSIAARYQLDKITYRPPLLGKWLTWFHLIQFSHCLNLALQSGMPIDQALLLARKLNHNHHFQHCTEQTIEAITEGSSFKQALIDHHQLPTFYTDLIGIGEQTNQLSECLQTCIEHYQQRLISNIEAISDKTGPILTLIISAVIGLIVIALYLPIFQIGGTLT